MKIQLKLIQALSVIGAGLMFTTGAYANELVNGDFELNPPTSGFGNHVGHPITPWVLGSGGNSNIIRTNQGINSTGQGPLRDASNTSSGTIRNYLDVVGGNEFYQTFKAKCSGEANFGGYFSTRGNQNGTASVTLRNGTGFTGSVVGQSNPVNLPRGNSHKDPWKLVSYASPVVAGNTYSLIIKMDNEMNFDEAFVKIKGCEGKPDPTNPGPFKPDDVVIGVPYLPDFPEIPSPVPVSDCCPPINETSIARQLTPVFQPGGGSNANYRLNFSATTQFNNQNQNYLNYVNSMRSPINTMISTWRILDHGPGGIASTPPASPSTQIEQFTTTFHVTNSINHGNTSSSYSMRPNRWYRVQVATAFNNRQTYFSKKCEPSEYYVNWQVGNKSSGSSGSFVISDGKKELARIKSEPRSIPMKAVPMKRR